MKTETNSKIRRITAISVFCALSYICILFIHFKVSFLTFDLKDSIMAIGAMYFGPIAAVIMPLIVSFVEFLTISTTGIYGLIMNFLSSAAFCLVASLIYKYKKTLAGAIISLVSASVVMTVVMIFANMYITPLYTGFPSEDIRALIPTLLLPFNLSKGIFNSCVVMMLYKPFATALRSAHILRTSEIGADTSATSDRSHAVTKLPVIIVSVVILVAVLLYLFLVLGAKIA